MIVASFSTTFDEFFLIKNVQNIIKKCSKIIKNGKMFSLNVIFPNFVNIIAILRWFDPFEHEHSSKFDPAIPHPLSWKNSCPKGYFISITVLIECLKLPLSLKINFSLLISLLFFF